MINRIINWHKKARRSDLVLLYTFGPWTLLIMLAEIYQDQIPFLAHLN